MARVAPDSEVPHGDAAMPPGAYDVWAGELGLYDPIEVPRDALITRFVRAFRVASATQRATTAATLSGDDGYSLLAFARRAAIFAMRHHDEAIVADGLSACAALDPTRIDERDILMALALLHHAAAHVGAPPRSLLEAAAAEAEAPAARLIGSFLERPATEQDLREAWGRFEVAAPGGVGLLQWEFRPWTPTLDVAAAAVHVAESVSAGDYLADDPALASALPEVWLSDARDPALGSILGSSRATALVHARLRPSLSPDHSSQQLSIWLVETIDAGAAQQLRVMAEHGREDTALLGVADGAMFGLVVARSFVQGVGAFETTASLARFRMPIAEALAAA